MTVEPMAWVGEIKTLMAAFFALAALVIYLRYARTERCRWLLLVGVLYVAALLSKPTATPLPLVLLLLDVWPLRRIGRRAILEKLPLLAIGLASMVITYISHARTAGIVEQADRTFFEAALLVGHNLGFYVHQLIYPVGLTPAYALPQPISLTQPAVIFGFVLTVVWLAAALVYLRSLRGLLIAGLVYVLSMVPTLGLVGYSWVVVSDKYIYLPVVGLAIGLTAVLTWAWRRTGGPIVRLAIVGFAVVFAVLLAVSTHRYLADWSDTDALYQRMIAVTPKSPRVRDYYAVELVAAGRSPEAVAQLERALDFDPDYAAAHVDLGLLLVEQGQYLQAIDHYNQALAVRPRYVGALVNRATAYQEIGQLAVAEADYLLALALDPDDATAHNNLGQLLWAQGQYDQAVAHYHQAVAAKPLFAEGHCSLANVYLSRDQVDQAIAEYQRALQINSELAAAHLGLGAAYRQHGQLDLAIESYRRALSCDPDYAEAHFNLANALMMQEQYVPAAEHYTTVTRLQRILWRAGFISVVLVGLREMGRRRSRPSSK